MNSDTNRPGVDCTPTDDGPVTHVCRRAFVAGLGAAGAGLLGGRPAGAEETTPGNKPIDGASGRPDGSRFQSFFDAHVPEQLAEHDVPGAAVAVVEDGRIAFTKGYGEADVAAGRPVRASETLFPLGPVSTAVTATAVLRGVEAGVLGLDTDVNEYLDRVTVPATHAAPVTLGHLGTHTAGFEERPGVPDPGHSDARSRLQAVVGDDPPGRVRPPGALVSMSDYGIDLAGYALATATGTPFPEVLRREVFEPLGMTHSTAGPRPVDDTDGVAATGYGRGRDGHDPGAPEVVAGRPSRGIYATARDVGRFMLAHLQAGRANGRQFLRPESVDTMHTVRARNHPAVKGVGFGLVEVAGGDPRTVGPGGDPRTVGLAGATARFTSVLLLAPAQDLGLFVAYNAPAASGAAALRDAFRTAFVSGDEPAAVTPDGTPARADEVTGWYRLQSAPSSGPAKLNGLAKTVHVDVATDGTLVTRWGMEWSEGTEGIWLSGGPARTAVTRWVEVEPLVFQAVDGHQRMAFHEGADAEIAELRLQLDAARRLAPTETPTAQGAALAVAGVLVLSGAIRWGHIGLRGRFGGGLPPDSALDSSTGAARPLAVVSGIAMAVGAAGAYAVLLGAPGGLSDGHPPLLAAQMVLATLGALGVIAAVGAAAAAWWTGRWRPADRVHYTVVVTALLTVGWLLAYWNVLWTPG